MALAWAPRPGSADEGLDPYLAGIMTAGDFIQPVVTTVGTDTVAGFTTFSISVTAVDNSDGHVQAQGAGAGSKTQAESVYALFGDDTTSMVVPTAFHVDPPFGADIGGTNEAFWAVNAESQFDSWLTINVADGTCTTKSAASASSGTTGLPNLASRSTTARSFG